LRNGENAQQECPKAASASVGLIVRERHTFRQISPVPIETKSDQIFTFVRNYPCRHVGLTRREPVSLRGQHMTSDELTDENRRMNAHDRGTFQRWMITNTVVGTIWAALLAVFAITSLFSGTNASSGTAEKVMSKHVEAR
jgi:hypothetical protein